MGSLSTTPPEAVLYQRLVAALKSRREQLRISQLDLDYTIGLCAGHVQKWEAQIRRPTGWNLMMWCLALGVTLTIEPLGGDHDRSPDQRPGAQSRRPARAAA